MSFKLPSETTCPFCKLLLCDGKCFKMDCDSFFNIYSNLNQIEAVGFKLNGKSSRHEENIYVHVFFVENKMKVMKNGRKIIFTSSIPLIDWTSGDTISKKIKSLLIFT